MKRAVVIFERVLPSGYQRLVELANGAGVYTFERPDGTVAPYLNLSVTVMPRWKAAVARVQAKRATVS